MDFIHLWRDDRALSKILHSTIPIPIHGLKVKVTDFEFLCLIFTVSVSVKPWLIWIMFGMNRYKILKCFIKEKHNYRRAFLSGDRSYQHWNLLSHFSRELWGLEDWNLVHMWTVGRCIMCTGIRLLLLIRPFISSFFFLSNFQHWNFSSHFSRELLGLEDWKLVHTWTDVSYIPETGCCLIHPFMSSFFFLTNFQH